MSKTEPKAGFYDEIYSKPYNTDRYLPIYETVIRLLLEKSRSDSVVLEVGCGTGALALMIKKEGIRYRGFDFSEVAVNQAQRLVGPGRVFVADAYDPEQYKGDYNTAVLVETLEHVDDLKVLLNIRAGTRIIATFPNFDNEAHLRIYEDIEVVRERFKGLLHVHKHGIMKSVDGLQIIIIDGVMLADKPLESELKPRISACLIVKNEQDMIAGCLYSIRSFVDEIIICDTGSTDRTVDICLELAAHPNFPNQIRLFHDPWQSDFSHHRNLSISRATKDWIFIIDADERFMPEDIDALLKDLQETNRNGVEMRVYNDLPGAPVQTFSKSLRFFKRSTGWIYKDVIHNSLQVPEREPIFSSAARLRHLGYDLSPKKKKEKWERTRTLLEKQYDTEPNVRCSFNLGNSILEEFMLKGEADLERAVEMFRWVIAHTDSAGFKRHFHLMARCQRAWAYLFAKNWEAAIKDCQIAVRLKKDYLDAHLVLGHAFKENKNYEEAIQAYKGYLFWQERYDPDQDAYHIAINNMDSREVAEQGMQECQVLFEQHQKEHPILVVR